MKKIILVALALSLGLTGMTSAMKLGGNVEEFEEEEKAGYLSAARALVTDRRTIAAAAPVALAALVAVVADNVAQKYKDSTTKPTGLIKALVDLDTLIKNKKITMAAAVATLSALSAVVSDLLAGPQGSVIRRNLVRIFGLKVFAEEEEF